MRETQRVETTEVDEFFCSGPCGIERIRRTISTTVIHYSNGAAIHERVTRQEVIQ